MIAESESLSHSLIFALILSGLITWLSYRKGFYSLPSREETPLSFSFFYPLLAFATYFFFSTIGALLILKLPKEWIHAYHKGTFQLFSILFVLVGFILLLLSLKKEVVKYIFTGNPFAPTIFSSFLKNIQWGIVSWIVSYPLVLLAGVLTQIISLQIWGKKGIEQLAVEHLKNTLSTPLLFISFSLVIVFIVPFIEELLFRGFLQTWMRKKWGRYTSITLTALIFSFFHFSSKQGTGNIELIVSLFVLSSFLGFLYEKQRNLWAPYALHMTFNAISIVGILLDKK